MDKIECLCMAIFIIGLGLGALASLFLKEAKLSFDIKATWASGFLLGCAFTAGIILLIYLGGGK